jgi:hypothetical protein
MLPPPVELTMGKSAAPDRPEPNLVLFLFQMRKIRYQSRKDSKDRSKIPKVSAYGPWPV